MTTIVCGVDSSRGARAAVRVATSLAEAIGGRVVAVHVLDRLVAADATAEAVAADVLYDEAPDARATARGGPATLAPMTLSIVQLGSPRAPGEGLRIGTVRRPPRAAWP